MKRFLRRLSVDNGAGEQEEKVELNPCDGLSFSVGVAETKNGKYRRSMEDVHTYVANFAERLDWGYFGVFDGHAGKETARWAGAHLHELVYESIKKEEFADLRQTLNKSFLEADKQIANLNGVGQSGSTAAVAILRWEIEGDDEVSQNQSGSKETKSEDGAALKDSNAKVSDANNSMVCKDGSTKACDEAGSKACDDSANGSEEAGKEKDARQGCQFDFVPTSNHKRMLYTANVGDSKIVLSRKGKPVCLTYEHKGSDKAEIKRIYRNGGLVLRGRVNGVLAVSRSLGDFALKEWVIGTPYTTSVELSQEDEYIIIACDGLWDVCDDKKAVKLIHGLRAQEAADKLVSYALENNTTDNVTVLVVKLNPEIFSSIDATAD